MQNEDGKECYVNVVCFFLIGIASIEDSHIQPNLFRTAWY
jgi:hypothetical protein